MRKFFVDLIHATTLARQAIINVLFFGGLGLLLMVVFLLSQSNNNVTVKPNTVLQLDLRGRIVEAPSSPSMSELVEKVAGVNNNQPDTIVLWDTLQAIRRAARDPNIVKINLRVDGMDAGMAQARELAQALSDFKKSGKPIVTFATGLDQVQYLVAAQATTINLDPLGEVDIEGLNRYRQYFRAALEDKLGIRVHLFRVGEFKSAAEPYILDGASPEAKEADLYWMSDVWTRYINDVAAARHLSPASVSTFVNNLPTFVEKADGNLAKMAQDNKWVDNIMTEDAFEASVASPVSLALPVATTSIFSDSSKRQPPKMLTGAKNRASSKKSSDELNVIGLDDYLHTIPTTATPDIALLVLEGEIVDDASGSHKIAADEAVNQINQLQDSGAKAVVLRIDSPGGSAAASERIRRAIENVREEGIPVVVSMGNTAASGGYWIAMNADDIVADPSTVTGSIGIFGMVPDISGALNKLGVHTDGVSTTTTNVTADITRPMSQPMADMMQSIINQGYKQFISNVAQARGMSRDTVDKVARGRVWSGAQAKERGLVDHLGGLQDAVNSAAALAHLSNPSVGFAGSDNNGDGSWATSLLKNAQSHTVLVSLGSKLGLWQLLALNQSPPWLQSDDADFLIANLRNARPGHMQVYAHCLCEQTSSSHR